MAKYKQECIFGIRAVIEAIQQEREIDKVMLKKGNKGELFQQLFGLIRERDIPFQYVPEEVFKPFADRNHQGVLAEISPVAYQELGEVLDTAAAEGKVPFVLILDRVTDVRNFGAIVRSAECAGVDAVVIPNKKFGKNLVGRAEDFGRRLVPRAGVPGAELEKSGTRTEIPTEHPRVCRHGKGGEVLHGCRHGPTDRHHHGVGRQRHRRGVAGDCHGTHQNPAKGANRIPERFRRCRGDAVRGRATKNVILLANVLRKEYFCWNLNRSSHMMSISQVVEQVIKNRPYLTESLAAGIINVSP